MFSHIHVQLLLAFSLHKILISENLPPHKKKSYFETTAALSLFLNGWQL